MSSRRKSRPVRRSDIPPGDQPFHYQTTSDDVFEDQSYQDSLPTPEDSPQDPNLHQMNQSKSNSDDDRSAPVAYTSPSEKRLHHPPEGVYIVQPQGVSDDEDQETKEKEMTKQTIKPEVFTEYQSSDVASKKRQMDENVDDEAQREGRGSGLDLTIKRRKVNAGSMERNSPGAEDEKMYASQANMQRFESFVKLFAAKRRSSDDANNASGNISTHTVDGDPQHFRQSQLPVAASNSNTEEIVGERRLEEDNDIPSASYKWSEQATNKDDEDNWDEKINYSASATPSTQHLAFSSSLSPAVAAAMMASLVSKSDARTSMGAQQRNTEVLQNLFKQSQNLLSQQGGQMKKQVGGARYSTSPDSMDTITAGTVSSGVGSIKRGTLDPTNFDEEVFDKYISRFNAKNSCNQPSCPHINREHFHCTDSDCNFQRFTNKSDVIRHYNMHKKRDNSLAHGFMRFAPTDDCQSQFGSCHLNGKSTHYHCLHPNCSRVYTSTSDVMTHENFHKKNQHFVTNGFQRYRATEMCGADFCPFRNQRTTHFHCTRSGCNFTFKNKCDIDKHKSYHVRDDAYTRQGFKKFYKNEPCGFSCCAWNKTANHFHCLRKNCEFSFTSTGQMVSHKRKHDRQDLMIMDRTSTTPPSSMSSKTLSKEHPPALSSHLTSSSSLMKSDALPHLQHPRLDAGYAKANVFRSLSLLHPLFRPAFLHHPETSRNLELGSSGPFDFQEAARKVLAAIPSSVASAALPRSLSNFNRSESFPSSYNSSATSPVARTSESSSHYREEIVPSVKSEHGESYYARPPPPYVEAPLKESNQNPIKHELGDRRRRESEESDRDDWPVVAPRHGSMTSSTVSQTSYNLNQTMDNSSSDNQVLNLSSKTANLEKNILATSSSMQTANLDAMLKYFRGFSPNECHFSNCVFGDRYHFHCVIQDCNAIFTEKSLVMSHTVFHDKLEKLGISQMKSREFSMLHPSVSRSVSFSDPSSPPPPGYIALPITNSNKQKDVHQEEEIERPKYSFNSSLMDARRPDEEEMMKDEEHAPEPLPRGAESQNQAPSSQTARSAVYEYISRIINENKSIAGFLPGHQSTPITSGAIPFTPLQSPAMLASYVRSQSCNYPESKEEGESSRPTNPNSGAPPSDGFIHVRAGSACVRADCKYVLQSHWHCTLNRCRYVCKSLAKAQSHRQAHDSLEAYARAAKECFKSYTVKKNCPNLTCEFRLRGHYHCLKPGCQFVTIGTSKLPWHMKKHEKIAKREASGFKYYTKKDQCGKKECKYNGMFSHYHCIRAGCSFAFQYKHQMSTHVRKHIRRMLGRSYSGPDISTDLSNLDHSNVDSGDDSLPLIVDEADEIEQRPGVVAEEANQVCLPQPLLMQNNRNLTDQQYAALEKISRGFQPSVPFARIEHGDNNREGNSESEKGVEDGSIDGDVEGISSSDDVLDLRATSNYQDVDSGSNSPSQTGFTNDRHEDNFGASDAQDTHVHHSMELERNATPSFQIPDRQEDSGKLFSKFRLNNDVMNGFKRFEMTENCGDPECNYAQKVSHYHCLHEDCNYRFTGRTHMFKHRQHHERVAGLVRDDFKRFKATQNCQDPECTFNCNSTHFHCLRCPFKCTDSAKVGVHRRQHVKADTLEQSGFERFRGKDDCGREACKYRNRNTSHFHCLQPGCNYAVVGLTGIEQHSKKHKRLQQSQQSDQVNFSIITKPFISHTESPLNTSIFPAPSILSSNLLTYSVPFTALSSASSVHVRGNDVTSPLADNKLNTSPSFMAPIVASQLHSGSQMCDASEARGFINLANLGMKREIPGGPVSAGLNL